MTDFFKNNPASLRHCLVYEFLQKKPVELAFSDFCKTVGNNAIKKEEFQFCFNQFEQGRFDDNPIDNIIDILRNDKQALRVCVLFEWATWKATRVKWWTRAHLRNEALPVFARYENFCKVIGNDVMDYREFDFWFYRFFNGEFDLNFEADKDKKQTYELANMPIDIMENVVEYLDIFDRMKLAKTSRSFRTFVENQKLFHRTLKLNISNTRVTIWFNKSVNSEYVRTIDSCVKHHKKRRTFVRGVAYWKQALLDLNSVLKNPKLHLDTLEVVLDTDNKHVFNDLEDASKFDHHLNVENLILRVYSLDKLPNIIPSLKPGYLTSIYIDSHNPNVNLMEKVFEMEQWMQAKYFTIEGFFISPLRNFYHLKKFTVNLNKLSLEDIREIKEVLFGSSKFEKCSLRVVPDYTYRSICEQEFGNALREDPSIYHCPIPNSTEYFEIEVGGWTLNIQRHNS